MPLLICVRHGQSTYNLENRFTGDTDVELTELGRDEARIAAVKMNGLHLDIAYTSKLKRAQDTLNIILEGIGQPSLPVVKDAALNERMYGNLQGLNKAETADKYGIGQVETWRRSFDVAPPGGESLRDTYNRAVPFYRSEIEPKLKAGLNVLIVAHGNSLRALMMYLESLDANEIPKVNILTGWPRLYTMDNDLKVLDVKYL